MAQAGFVHEEDHGQAANDASLTMSASIYADRNHIRETMQEDCAAAGFRLRESGGVAALGEGEAKPLAEILLLDCPNVDPATMAALSRLDMRAARAGAHLVVSTSVESLDTVFACLEQSNPQILVDPSRAERVLALGRVLARVPNLRLRELSEEDRLTMLRLTEQVGKIAERLERMEKGSTGSAGSSAFAFESPKRAYRGPDGEADSSERLIRATRPPLPDARLVRQIIRRRQMRGRFFDAELFADPAWDILLDLTAARVEHERVSVTSLCIASGVPPTTALRWIGQMTDAGLLERVEDDTDRRRAFIQLTDKAVEGMARYFSEVGKDAAHLV